MDRVEKLAALLGIADDAQDAILAHCLNAAEGLILDYCCPGGDPAAAGAVLLDLAVDGYRLGGYGQAAGPLGPRRFAHRGRAERKLCPALAAPWPRGRTPRRCSGGTPRGSTPTGS